MPPDPLGGPKNFFSPLSDHVIWNNSAEFNNVLIHLGDFHTMMEFFCIIGKIITGSGFEGIVYQARICTSGGIIAYCQESTKIEVGLCMNLSLRH